ncbi:hypothetical protein HAPAU_08570 [Halalkalicoccus paucihalophilus]|uniref:DUF8001 domain-containing protein n=1 Tax=Halalkalicoccus paucihalophilus TaxID=1008153 RepID=A0A151AH36_9EURY|nr:hypothetical protein [Halalkalicoccus paucihalophilus]KYH26969.1 hypothetical protein HAPAU_08570 [Halalkalicoccus paucihalophilus]
MVEPLRVQPDERSTEELIELLDSGRRVLIEVEIAGTIKEIALRQRDGVYYCDTPTTLHTHETRDGIRKCLENQGYAAESER